MKTGFVLNEINRINQLMGTRKIILEQLDEVVNLLSKLDFNYFIDVLKRAAKNDGSVDSKQLRKDLEETKRYTPRELDELFDLIDNNTTFKNAIKNTDTFADEIKKLDLISAKKIKEYSKVSENDIKIIDQSRNKAINDSLKGATGLGKFYNEIVTAVITDLNSIISSSSVYKVSVEEYYNMVDSIVISELKNKKGVIPYYNEIIFDKIKNKLRADPTIRAKIDEVEAAGKFKDELDISRPSYDTGVEIDFSDYRGAPEDTSISQPSQSAGEVTTISRKMPGFNQYENISDIEIISEYNRLKNIDDADLSQFEKEFMDEVEAWISKSSDVTEETIKSKVKKSKTSPSTEQMDYIEEVMAKEIKTGEDQTLVDAFENWKTTGDETDWDGLITKSEESIPSELRNLSINFQKIGKEWGQANIFAQFYNNVLWPLWKDYFINIERFISEASLLVKRTFKGQNRAEFYLNRFVDSFENAYNSFLRNDAESIDINVIQKLKSDLLQVMPKNIGLDLKTPGSQVDGANLRVLWDLFVQNSRKQIDNVARKNNYDPTNARNDFERFVKMVEDSGETKRGFSIKDILDGNIKSPDGTESLPLGEKVNLANERFKSGGVDDLVVGGVDDFLRNNKWYDKIFEAIKASPFGRLQSPKTIEAYYIKRGISNTSVITRNLTQLSIKYLLFVTGAIVYAIYESVGKRQTNKKGDESDIITDILIKPGIETLVSGTTTRKWITQLFSKNPAIKDWVYYANVALPGLLDLTLYESIDALIDYYRDKDEGITEKEYKENKKTEGFNKQLESKLKDTKNKSDAETRSFYSSLKKGEYLENENLTYENIELIKERIEFLSKIPNDAISKLQQNKDKLGVDSLDDLLSIDVNSLNKNDPTYKTLLNLYNGSVVIKGKSGKKYIVVRPARYNPFLTEKDIDKMTKESSTALTFFVLPEFDKIKYNTDRKYKTLKYFCDNYENL